VDTVREFAERVLFGETLEEKLAPPPSGLADTLLGPAIATPLAPGRPQELRLREDGVRAAFPGIGRIETDEARGRLLHFFANHELLATELMALVLLKFPEAPQEFRAGILKTLKEEQMHTKMYLKRMTECGVDFGDLPLNGFFWNLVAPMSTPLDYVTRLSLTFEQANLDYSRGYAKVFKQAGDLETAAILERIYQDEISHVHYGLSWFRRWKDEESDWKAYRSLLSQPLSAARAKGGFEFNEEGRREAGLDEEFIRELKVYAQSKGRTPNVYWFNPGAEESLTESGPSEVSRMVGRDLGLLIALVARREDVVFLDRVPPTEHLLSLANAGVEFPELLAWEKVEEVAARKLGWACPWAATPDAEEGAEKLGLPLKKSSPQFFSKIEHATFLQRLLESSQWELLCPEEVVGQVVRSLSDLERWRSQCSWAEGVLKVPFSTAGRDRLRLLCAGSLSEKAQAWVTRMLGVHGELLVEPWLDRELDFSMQYDHRSDGTLARRGFVVMENSEAGQFRQARVTKRLTDALDEPSRRLVFSEGGRKGGLLSWIETVLEPALGEWLTRGEYLGPLGIDALFYRDFEGALRLKPVVEINPRYTMGRVAVELDARLSSSGEAVLGIQRVGETFPEGCQGLTPVYPDTRLVAYWGKQVRGSVVGDEST